MAETTREKIQSFERTLIENERLKIADFIRDKANKNYIFEEMSTGEMMIYGIVKDILFSLAYEIENGRFDRGEEK